MHNTRREAEPAAFQEHKAEAMRLRNSGVAKAEIRKENELYSEVKRARWLLPSDRSSIPENMFSALNSILDSHSDLAVCHSMNEEMCRLFGLTDRTEAEKGWRAWFAAAMENAIPHLVQFVRLREKRIDGLITLDMDTGMKAISSLLIRYISIPSLKPGSLNKT